ncbi:hypothetical protein MCOR25_010894 [Pyricularia grisea]|nr:hypothetical protein MCOR25_010894 [Pyricularia grisea]
MNHHPLQRNQSLIASLRSLTELEKWPEFDALEADFNRSFDAGSEDARQVREHDSLVQAMQAAEAGVHRNLETKTRWAAVEMARVKRVQLQADALMAEAKVMRDEAGREMKRARQVEDEVESEISRHEEVVESIKGKLGRIAREREGRRVTQERRFKAAVGRLWQTVEDMQGVRPVVGETHAQTQVQVQPKKVKPERPAPLLLSSSFSHTRPDSTSQNSPQEKNALDIESQSTRDRPIGALSISQLLIDPKEEPSSATSHSSPPPPWDCIQLPIPDTRGQFHWPPPRPGPDALPPPGVPRSDAKSSSRVISLPSYKTWRQHQPVSPPPQLEPTGRKRRAVECMPQSDTTVAMTAPQLSIPCGVSVRSLSPVSCSPLSTTSSLPHIPTTLRLPPPIQSFPTEIQPSHHPLPHVPPPAQPTTGQVPFKRKHNTIPPPPLSHQKPKPADRDDVEAADRWDTSFLTPEAGLLGSVSWEQFRNDSSKYPLHKRWLCQRRKRVKGARGAGRGPLRWLVFKCPAHPARVIDCQKELERHYLRDHADVKTAEKRLEECAIYVRGCRDALASSHNARITRDTYAVDWGSEGPVSPGGVGDGRQGGGVREQVPRAVSENGLDAWESRVTVLAGTGQEASSA